MPDELFGWILWRSPPAAVWALYTLQHGTGARTSAATGITANFRRSRRQGISQPAQSERGSLGRGTPGRPLSMRAKQSRIDQDEIVPPRTLWRAFRVSICRNPGLVFPFHE